MSTTLRVNAKPKYVTKKIASAVTSKERRPNRSDQQEGVARITDPKERGRKQIFPVRPP
jgi:hypothetical protein